MIYQKRLNTKLWHQLQDVLAMHEQVTISNGVVKNYAQNGKGLTGSARFRTKGLKDKFLLSLLSCFFCLLLIWHGCLNLSYQLNTLFCANHEFKLFPFIHALRYHVCVWYQIMLLIWSIQFVSVFGNEDISLIKRVSFLLGRTVYISINLYFSHCPKQMGNKSKKHTFTWCAKS